MLLTHWKILHAVPVCSLGTERVSNSGMKEKCLLLSVEGDSMLKQIRDQSRE